MIGPGSDRDDVRPIRRLHWRIVGTRGEHSAGFRSRNGMFISCGDY
jgi:hypothetical protein